MSTKPFIMGGETEYSLADLRVSRRVRAHSLHEALTEAICYEHRWAADIHNPLGIYLDNGARCYSDLGHYEFCSPELFTPRQVAVYDRAGEEILLAAKAALLSRHADLRLCITKHNINFTSPEFASWGHHESYTCWISQRAMAEQITPHLVSRLPYAGAGYLTSDPDGMGFGLLQRASHITKACGEETTQNRAIFCVRNCKPWDRSVAGWTRAHLLCADSKRCPFGVYLSFGVTALLFMIANEGHRIGRSVELNDPVAAMHTISRDPWLQSTVELSNGKTATAVDIQRQYLTEARPFVESGDYPDWTPELLMHWSQTLDQLETDPTRLADRLDVYRKLQIFDHLINRAGMTWALLRSALQTLTFLRRTVSDKRLEAMLAGDEGFSEVHLPASRGTQSSHREFGPSLCQQLQVATRLQSLEMNYHELGGQFDGILASSSVGCLIAPADAVENAIRHPPCGGRAEARARSIVEFEGQSWAGDWTCLFNATDGQMVDLTDPFSNQREVQSWDRRRRNMPGRMELDQIFAQVHAFSRLRPPRLP